MYHFDQTVDRRNTNSIKWDRQTRAFGTEGLLPFWIADTDFSVAPEIQHALMDRVSHPIYGYACPGKSYISSIVNWFEKRYHWTIRPDWIIPATGVVTAAGFAMDAVTSPGDKVMLLTPMYDPFFGVIKGSGRELVTLDLTESDGAYVLDLNAFEEKLKTGVKALILCNPHNPAGKVWTYDELDSITRLCAHYHVYILSDDIHCDIVLEGHTYTPAATFDCARHLTATFTAPSKTFNVAGAGCANIIVENEELRNKIHKSLMSKFLMGPGLFGYVICEAAYSCGESWLEEQLVYLKENSRFVTSFFKTHMPDVRTFSHEGTYLMWVDFRKMGLGSNELCQEFIKDCGIAMNRGNAFGDSGDGFMRLNIGCQRSLLEELMNRLLVWYKKHDEA